MGEPSPSAAEPVESQLMELIQLYRVEQAMLIAHQREVERRRAAVRTAAEREASELLLAARREIRRVLVRTRQELASLTAQVRAAGCEAPPGQLGQSIADDAFQVSAARDVRDVLRDARSELTDLSRAAVNVWPAGENPRLLPPAVAMAPLSEPAAAAADDVSSAPTLEESAGPADGDREQASTTGAAEQSVVVRWRSAQVPITSAAEGFLVHWRIAAVALVILVVVALAIMALRPSPKTEGAVTTSRPDSVESSAQDPATEAPTTKPTATAGSASAAAIDPFRKTASEVLSLSLEVRKPVWLRVNADGGEDPGRTYQQGERRTIQANREIVLRAGDAGAVFVSLGGGAPVPLGPDGQVRTRRFAHEGAVATAQAGEGAAPTRASGVPPPAQAVPNALAAGIESAAVPSAIAAPRTAVPASTPEQPEPVATAADQAATEREILERHQRWFDAFARGDRAAMASLAADNFSLVDQRPGRAPAGAGPAGGFIHDVRVQVTAGVGAVVSGRMTEVATPEAAPTVAMFSEVWIRQAEEWRLVTVRLVPLSAVTTTLQ